MAFDPALPPEGPRHNIYPEMRFAAGPVAGVALMQMRFVADLEAFGNESFAQLVRDNVFDGFLGRHGGGNSHQSYFLVNGAIGSAGIRNVKT
jgi:hypothetical protein